MASQQQLECQRCMKNRGVKQTSKSCHHYQHHNQTFPKIKSDETNSQTSGIESLPDIALLRVLKFCSIQTLGKLSQVNKFFNVLISQNQVWRVESEKSIFAGISVVSKCGCKRSSNGLHCIAHHNKCTCVLSLKDRVHYGQNWKCGRYGEYKLLRAVQQMPKIYIENGLLYRTDRNIIYRYRQKCNGQIQTSPVLSYTGLANDVCGFTVSPERVTAVSVWGGVRVWDHASGDVISSDQTDHHGAVTSLAAYNDLIFTGSKDKTIGIWSLQGQELRRRHQLNVNDRVWSIALENIGRSQLACGSAGCTVPALSLWDINRGELIDVLDCDDSRHGGGILDIQYLTSSQLLTCGYDTMIRLWDTRSNQCVRKWEDPFDVTVYCIRALGPYSMVSGTARYGMARLWDQRMTNPVQKYYVSKTTSPVYSLAYEPSYLYLALDKGIHLLDFTVNK